MDDERYCKACGAGLPPSYEPKMEKLREIIAELEHEQWMEWSKGVVAQDAVYEWKIKKWKLFWRPYSELTEEQKNQDRVWADKIIAVL